MRINELSERDFEALREPLASGRQSPSGLAFVFPVGTLLQLLMLFFIYVAIKEYPHFSYKEQLFIAFLIYAISVIVVSIPFTFKTMWKRYENTQYLLTIVVSQNIGGLSWYLISLITLAENIETYSLLTFIFVSLLTGVLVLFFTYRRLIKLLENGAYRKGSKKAKIRAGVEKEVASHQPTIIVLSVGLVFILQFLFRHTGFSDSEDSFLIILGLGLFYTMLFVLPEQLVIYYCKRRFKSFRFDEDGNLNPLEYKQHRNDAELSKKKRKQMRQMHKRKS